jgi:hypothetical protein
VRRPGGTRLTRLGALAGIILLPACHARRAAEQAGAVPCTAPAPADSLSPSATAAVLAGEYRLHLAATSGSDSGRSVEGMLRLWPLPDSLAHVTVLGARDTTADQPLGGSAELDREALGVLSTGDLGGSDPTAPGVLVIEHHPPRRDARPQIVLRMGSEANRRGRVRYDGGYFALMVRTLGDHGFTGTWASGAGPTSAGARGHFCAERVEQES